jgi:hypothetical protein
LIIVIALITANQLERSQVHFKRLTLPEGEPTLPCDVGMLFRILLAFYTVIYLVYNIIYAVYIAADNTFPLAFAPGMLFTEQFSDILFYAILLSIIAYRQRIQLNPEKNYFNLKFAVGDYSCPWDCR